MCDSVAKGEFDDAKATHRAGRDIVGEHRFYMGAKVGDVIRTRGVRSSNPEVLAL
jgi:hypothetical protein